MMLILRILLYLTCIISLGWSILIFGGPLIIKRLIETHSNGALIASDVTISPRLDIRISRLEFNLPNGIVGQHIEGFSRAAEIAWSIFSEKPFLEINVGPSVLKGSATADRVIINTPPLQKMDWQNIALEVKIENLARHPFAKAHSVILEGNLNVDTGNVSNVRIAAEKFSATDGSSTYFANSISGDLSELNFITPVTENLSLSAFEIEGIVASEPSFTVPKAQFEISATGGAKTFKIDLHDVMILEFDGYIENLKVEGNFNKFNSLQELRFESVDAVFYENLPKFLKLSARINKFEDNQYEVSLEGNLEEFELFNADNFIGSLPDTNFRTDLKLDTKISKVASVSKINFNTSSAADITSSVDLDFSSEVLMNLGCELLGCDLSDFDLSYEINLDDEWIKGSASCPKSFCDLSELEHLIRTSNTVNIFTILNQENVLNPLSSLYLFGAISSGQKINGGHELKFEF